jgi:hypothetical protein
MAISPLPKRCGSMESPLEDVQYPSRRAQRKWEGRTNIHARTIGAASKSGEETAAGE